MSMEMKPITRSNVKSTIKISEVKLDIPEEETTQHVVEPKSPPRDTELHENDGGLDSDNHSNLAMGISL